MDPVVPTAGGFEAVFLTDVPVDLICIICHLALREPRQIMECGHRFCGTCFEAMVSYSKHLNTELHCPVDRSCIDINEVFKDNGAARTVRNLEVKCGRHEHGCNWTGALGDLAGHNETCLYQEEVPAIQQKEKTTELEVLCKDLLQRVVHCEETLSSKEKELVHLKYTVSEMKEVIKKNENEIVSLKEANSLLKSEVRMLKQQQENNYQEVRKEVAACALNNSSSQEACMDYINEQKALMEKKIQDTKDQPSTRNLDNLIVEMDKLQTDIRANRSHIDGSITETKKEIEIFKGTIGNIEGKTKLVEELKSHVENVENVLYLSNSVKSNIFRYQWVLQNYQYHLEKGETVFSPTFFSQVLGYRVRLRVQWTGVEKLGFYFQLVRGEYEDGSIFNLENFNLDVDLEILSKSGESRLCKYRSSGRHKFPECFTIPENEKEAHYIGKRGILTSPYDDYIIEDSMYLTCSMHLQ